MYSQLLTAAALLGSAAALPTMADSSCYDTNNHTYIKPLATDSRSPCPGLNTLANHGYLPRDGRNVQRSDMVNGFLNGFGLDETAITVALEIAYQTCMWVTNKDCGNTLDNLTLLAQPHVFEHDMSLSRNDANMAYSGPSVIDDALGFNQTIFNQALDVIGNNTHMDYSMFQQIRLARESDAIQNDSPGWFIESRAVQLVEVGFQYGAFSDLSLNDSTANPQIRVDWWKYFFVNESFPTPLGWKKPPTPRNVTYVLSVSSRVQTASITSTPSYLPSAYSETGPSPGLFPSISPSTIRVMPTETVYAPSGTAIPMRRRGSAYGNAAPGASPSRSSSQVNPTAAAHFERLQRAEELVGRNAMPFNPYTNNVKARDLAAIAAYNQDRVSRLQSAYAALATSVPAATVTTAF